MKSSLQMRKREKLSFFKKAIVLGGIASILYLLIGMIRLPMLLEELLLPPITNPNRYVSELILTLTLFSAGFGIFSFGWWKEFQTRLFGQIQTEDALRESEERYRRLVEMSPDAIAVHIEGKFVYVNPSGVKLLGAKNADELLGKSVLTIVHPYYHDTVRKRVQMMTEEGREVPLIEEKFIRVDGQIIDVEVAAVPFTYQGNPAVQVVARDISDRKRSGKIVKEWQERYEKVLSITDEIVYDWDLKKNSTVWSATLQTVLGYVPEELSTKKTPWESYIHPDEREHVTRQIENALSKSSTIEIDYRLRHKNGEYRFIHDRAFIFRDEQGNAIRSIGSITDITDRKLAEEARFLDQQRYKTLFEFSPSGVMLEDANGTIVDANESFFRMTGYSREELIGNNVRFLAPPQHREQVQKHITKILSGNILEHQVENIKKDGTSYSIEIRERMIRLPNGQDGILVVANDISERLQQEQKLKNQFEQLQSIYFLTAALNHTDDIDIIYQESLSAITRNLHIDRASLLLFDKDGILRFKAWRGISDWYRSKVEGHTPWNPQTTNPAPIFVSDVRNEQSLATYHPVFEKEHIVALGFIPLVFQDRLLGKFMVYFDAPHVFTETEVQILLTIAGHIAFAIERRQAMAELAASEERYRTLSEAAHDAIFIINKNDEVEYVNSFAAQMFNDVPLNIIGKQRMNLFPGEAAARQGEALRKIFATGKPMQSENPLPTKAGLRWHDTHLVPIKNQEGTVTSVLGISRDITERKKVEDALRLSVEQQELVLRSLPMVFYTTDVSRTLATTWISEQVERITGFSPNHFIEDAKFWESRIHPDDIEHAMSEYNGVIKQNTTRTEYRWKCADGSYRWFEDQTVLIRDSAGNPKEIIGIWLDITNQMRAEESVRESEARWRSLMESSPGLVHEIDRQGKILYINRATPGYERDSVIGSTIYDYVSTETALFMRQQVEEVFEKQHSVWFEVPAAGPYGSEAWYTCIIGPIIKDGKVASAIMDSIDITEHKHREHLQNTVYQIAQFADKSQSPEELFKGVHDSISEVMHASNFYIALYDEQDDLLSFPYFVDEVDVPNPPGRPGRGVTAYVLRTGKSLLCPQKKFEELVRQGEIELVGIPSPVWLGVPLIVEGKTIGVMAVQDYHDEHAYGDEELQVLEYVSSQIAMTIRRKQAEEDLQRSEERYRSLFEESKDVIYFTSEFGHIIEINPAGVELFGYHSKEELLTVDVANELYWEPRQREEESRIIRRQGYVQDFELELKRKDGTKITVLDTATTVRDSIGSIIGYRGIMRDITERKRSEEALRESYQIVEALIQASPLAINVLDLNGNVTIWNPKSEEIFGWTENDVIGKSLPYLTEDKFDEYNCAAERVRKGGVYIVHDTYRKRKDGTLVHVSISTASLRDGNNTIIGTMALINDITERKKAEEALRQSEIKLREIVEHSTNLFYSHTPEHVITYVSPQTRSYFDCEPEEALVRWTELATENPINNIGYDMTQRAIETGIRQSPFRLELVGKKARKIWVEVNESPVVLNGKTIAIVGSLTDITEKVKVEEEVGKLRKAIESLGEVVFITDKEGIITFANPEFTKLYGYTQEEVIGKVTPRILKSGSTSREDYSKIWETLLNRQFVKREIHNKTKEGKQVIVESSMSPVLDEFGNIDGFMAIQLDITEKKRLEEQFLRSQRLESLGTLAGGVAHDLNNVLAPILLSIDVLKRYATTDHAVKILQTIRSSAERGKHIIKQILSFARGSEGERGNIQLRHLIREMEQIAKETFPRSIEVHCSIQKELWTVLGDPTQLHQVLLNLCVNARDAMPDGGSLELKAENIFIDEHFAKMQYGAKVGPYVVLSVSDTGTGIPPEVLPKIFDPFFTTKPQASGTGLGLSTVHAIVKGHEGFIDVYSHIGSGTTFKVFLPAIESAEAIQVTKAIVEYPPGNGECVLVIDDEASVRDITKYTLEMYGYKVLTAGDGAKGVALYKERKQDIDVVITDMMMPVMDGNATILALKELEPSVKIIASSGLTTGSQISFTLETEVFAFLAKPYTAESLLKALHEVLTK
ncbi:MAG: PAS domain S-box protein [Ignavibacteriae bacterium]|nr:PAS domain S-box protein [Ignavibacteriota bacterium]